MSSLQTANMPGRRFPSPRDARWIVTGAWLLCCAVLLLLYRHSIPALAFQDPDDPMRLAQVRDWINGQSWFDVTQYRAHPPHGATMHWSRIVDLPIAALILLLRPFAGSAAAEILACTLTPLLLLGALTASLYVGVRRLIDRPGAILGVILLLTAPSILVQFTPLRIDHHDWQIVMAAVALAAMFDPRPVRGGIVTAAALATWLQISSESLPYVALFTGAMALHQWFRATAAPRFIAFAISLGALAFILLLLTRGWGALFTTYCDAFSAPYLWPLVSFGLATPIAARLIDGRSMRGRFLVAAIGGGAALVSLALIGGPCLSGDPFQALGPVAYKLWYMQVMEGLPVWRQPLERAGTILLPAIVGLISSAWAAWQTRQDSAMCDRWLIVTLLLAGATMVAALVMRALSVAHLFALPGIAWMILTLFHRAQGMRSAAGRVIGSSALVLLSPTGLCALWIALTTSAPEAAATTPTVSGQVGACAPGAFMPDLVALPPATLFAPLDIGPTILIRTHHKVIATGHHRNAAGITAVVEAFMAPPEQARAIISRQNGSKGVDYVVTCSDLNEFRKYEAAAPNGLAGMLGKGQSPTWLQPLPGKGPLRIYKVRRD